MCVCISVHGEGTSGNTYFSPAFQIILIRVALKPFAEKHFVVGVFCGGIPLLIKHHNDPFFNYVESMGVLSSYYQPHPMLCAFYMRVLTIVC